jgi:ParB-like chromosome segregation protein Spo0J
LSTSPSSPSSRIPATLAHSKEQIVKIAESIKAFRFHGVVLIDETHTIIAGHGRVAAATTVGMKDVPTVKVSGLSPAKLRALMLADNRIALDAGWNRETLAVEIPALTELLIEEGLSISWTGFEAAEVAGCVVPAIVGYSKATLSYRWAAAEHAFDEVLLISKWN